MSTPKSVQMEDFFLPALGKEWNPLVAPMLWTVRLWQDITIPLPDSFQLQCVFLTMQHTLIQEKAGKLKMKKLAITALKNNVFCEMNQLLEYFFLWDSFFRSSSWSSLVVFLLLGVSFLDDTLSRVNFRM
jgi:hypothetical protein